MARDVPDEQPEQARNGDGGAEFQVDPFALLQQVEADLNDFELPSQRSQLFRRAAEMFRARGLEDEGQRAEWQTWLFDFMLVSRDERRSRGYGRFAPAVEMQGRAYPHVAMFPPEALRAFKEELDRTANPIHRALYADFIWDQRDKYPGPKRETFEAAKTAVGAYLEAARLYRKNEWDDQLADAIDRASELALSIGDAGSRDRCKRACFELVDELVGAQKHPPTRWAIDVLETLQRFNRHLSTQDHQRIVSLAETGAAYYATKGKFYIERSFLDLLPASHRALGATDDATNALARQAATFIAEGDQAPSALGKLHFFGKALEAYQKLGNAKEVEDLKRRVSQAGLDAISEMETVSVEVKIPREVVEAWVNRLLARDLESALQALAATRRFIPRMDHIRAEAQRRRQQHPLQYLVSRLTLDSAGRIVQRTLTGDEQIAVSEADVYNFAMATGDWELGLAFERLQAQKGLTSETLMQFLRSRSIFEGATLDVVSVGMERYFASDYVSALHILVPQLEDTFRDILAKLGLSRISAQQGITREKPLDEVLGTPELREGLGKDLATFFERFLINGDSSNVRNRTAHGLLKLEHCTRETVRRVLLCYLQLANLTIVARPSSDVESSPTEDT